LRAFSLSFFTQIFLSNSVLFDVRTWTDFFYNTIIYVYLFTSINSGWIVVECIPSLWKNSLTCSAIFIYSERFLHLICALAIIRSPANCHTWNSCTANTPSIFSNKRCCIASTCTNKFTNQIMYTINIYHAL